MSIVGRELLRAVIQFNKLFLIRLADFLSQNFDLSAEKCVSQLPRPNPKCLLAKCLKPTSHRHMVLLKCLDKSSKTNTKVEVSRCHAFTFSSAVNFYSIFFDATVDDWLILEKLSSCERKGGKWSILMRTTNDAPMCKTRFAITCHQICENQFLVIPLQKASGFTACVCQVDVVELRIEIEEELLRRLHWNWINFSSEI